MSDSDWIINVTAETFKTEVVERSKTTPVLIDFWASWCGPCKALTPVLEKLVAEARGNLILAKVDTDKNQELAGMFQVQSIPMVVLVNGGKLVDAFNGALPEAEIRTFLEGVVDFGGNDPVAKAKELEAGGDRDSAIWILDDLLQDEPDNVNARLVLCAMLVDAGRTEDAKRLSLPLTEEHWELPAGQTLKAKLELAKQASGLGSFEAALAKNPKDLAARIGLGRALIGAQRQADGLEHLLEAAREDLTFDSGAARKAMLEAFEALGHDHPLTQQYRFQLQMLLLV